VDFDPVSKTFGTIKRFHRNYEGASKSMEAFILGRLVDRWMANENITGFVHDLDAFSIAVLKQKG
jgi:hypothetical protein